MQPLMFWLQEWGHKRILTLPNQANENQTSNNADQDEEHDDEDYHNSQEVIISLMSMKTAMCGSLKTYNKMKLRMLQSCHFEMWIVLIAVSVADIWIGSINRETFCLKRCSYHLNKETKWGEMDRTYHPCKIVFDSHQHTWLALVAAVVPWSFAVGSQT